MNPSGCLTDRGCDGVSRYLYGEPVQGTAYVVFGVKMDKEMRRLPSVKQVSSVSHCSVNRFHCVWQTDLRTIFFCQF